VRREDADLGDLVLALGGHEGTLSPLRRRAVHDAHHHDGAAVAVVPAVEEEGAQGGLRVALGGRHLLHDRLEDLLDADAGLAAGGMASVAVEADDVLDLLPGAVGVGEGRSILLRTGMISRLASTAR
jgi:hypothetical protein